MKKSTIGEEQIAKIAEWMDLSEYEAEDNLPDGDYYTSPYDGDVFNPIDFPSDTCILLEYAAKEYGRIEICEGGKLVCIGALEMAGGDNLAEALCAAILKIIDSGEDNG